MIRINNKDISNMLTDIKLKLVRTYKGDIERTQTGRVAAFPASFITVGFDLSFLGDRNDIEALEQVLMSSNLVWLAVKHGQIDIRGKFSCTGNDKTEVRDKDERHLKLSVSVVSDGSDISNSNGVMFNISYGSTLLVSNCSFGRVYKVSSTYANKKLNGYTLSENKVLVLGNCKLED
nr:MAG TPA: hypothetical protein [Caudoviricetes sp.]